MSDVTLNDIRKLKYEYGRKMAKALAELADEFVQKSGVPIDRFKIVTTDSTEKHWSAPGTAQAPKSTAVPHFVEIDCGDI